MGLRFYYWLLPAVAVCLPRAAASQTGPSPATIAPISAQAIQGFAPFDGRRVSISVAGSDLSGTFSSASVLPLPVAPSSLPSEWASTDVGLPTQPGTASYGAGVFAVTGGGKDIWGTADEFQYVYQQVTGDVEITGRVIGVEAVDEWTKGGLMLRDALTANAAHVSLLATPAHGVAFERRPAAGGGSLYSVAALRGAPRWMKLQRRGVSVTAYQSLDGWRWFPSGSATLDLPTIYVGLAVTSRKTTAGATALFDHVVIGAPNSPPAVELTAPDDQSTFREPATMEISAVASDDNAVAQVNYYADAMPIGSSATPPYTVTWTDVPAGTYSLRAVAFDYNHTLAVSVARTILVTPGSGTYTAVFGPSWNHDQAVTSYVLDIYEQGADPPVATPVATALLGKPVVVDGECRVDITSTVGTLPPGSFIATVTAFGPGGSVQSAASPPFVR